MEMLLEVGLIYFGIMNILAFVLYGDDKHKAKRGEYRISEATLIGVAAFGGALGAWLAMQIFRHKTKHPKFYIGVPVLLVLQIVLILILCIKFFFV